MAPDEKLLNSTESVCPECLKRIPAQNVRRGNDVYLIKECPDHGQFSTVIWRGEPAYESWAYPKKASSPAACATESNKGCPFDCGLCSDHHQQSCGVLLEVTSRCNLACPVCFAGITEGAAGEDPDLSVIESWYRMLLASGGPVNIQLSGGEPTVRDDLPDIVALGHKLGFNFIQINTNGLRLGKESEYVAKLKKAGLNCVFLQFDGTNDKIYKHIRGTALLELKEAAIRHCAENEIGVVLVSTLVPGINTGNIGELINYAVQKIPGVRAVHFQPIGYFGRYPKAPRDEGRITIPEVIRALESQTGGKVKTANFLPPAGENAHCSFHGNFVLMPDGTLKSWVSDLSGYYCAKAEPSSEGSVHARNFMAKQWSAPKEPLKSIKRLKEAPKVKPAINVSSMSDFLERVHTYTLSISGMAFQDAWNLDLDRLRDCHISIVSPDHRIIPFCAYNLTSCAGRALYRGKGPDHG
ncbi:radical SAM (seleno)protein TrsS [Sporomusa sp. KB1]|uniref:radical SAM (seleno)protein TrsS n=1 Tax=Sporomusa sp. KB1 TaxID=943346 RepID=UPI00119D5BF1|nr:radical SAM (seleno)protein TrsS [Sporomusa sp. KB1]TWH48733.1 hypothetical protein Salpa_4903 [Sporomusa sp. KB1]